MLSKNLLKHVRSLHQKKFRITHEAFIVEGIKPVQELCRSDFKVNHIFSIEEHMDGFPDVIQVSKADMERMSLMKTPPGVLAVAQMPSRKQKPKIQLPALLLEDLNDPGNLGTLIRTAEWFGRKQLLITSNTADEFNPKCVQASMGSLFRMEIIRLEESDLAHLSEPMIGLDLHGESLYEHTMEPAIYVLGRESTGLSQEIRERCEKMVTIPGQGKTESLNAAMSGGLLLSEIFRKPLT